LASSAVKSVSSMRWPTLNGVRVASFTKSDGLATPSSTKVSRLYAASVARVEKAVVGHLQVGGMVLFTTHHEVELAGAQVQSVELGVC